MTIVDLSVTAPIPTTILEALQQRHAELSKRHQEALKNGDGARARRFDRQIKVKSQ